MANLIIPVSVQLGNSLGAIKRVYSGLGSLEQSANQAAKGLGNLQNAKGPISLKAELRAAEAEVKNLVNKFGELDPRIEAAARKAAQLRAVSRDAADAISRYDFETGAKAFAGSLANVGQVVTGVAGAFAFLDDNSKESLKTIKNLQAAFSFTQGLSAIGDLEDSLKNITQIGKSAFNAIVNGIVSATGATRTFSTVLASTGIGLLAVGIGLAINAISEYNDKLKETAEATKKAKEENERLANAVDNVAKNSQGYVSRQIEIIKNEEKIKDLEIDGEKNAKAINALKRRNLDLTIQELNTELSGKKGLLSVNDELELKGKIFRAEREKERITLQENADAAKRYAEALKRMVINIAGPKLSDLIGSEKFIQRFGGTIEQLQLKLKNLQDTKVKAKTILEVADINTQIDAVQKQIDKFQNIKFRAPAITVLAPTVKVDPISQIPLTEAEKSAKELSKNVSNILSTSLDQGIQDGFMAFGEALAAGEDPFAALGKSLLTSLGNLATTLGKEIITLGVIFKALSNTIGNLGAAGKIAVGFALLAFGAAVKAAVAKNAKKAGFARGGYVDGPGTETSDSIPAQLSKGEYVIKARSVRKYGKDFLNKINNGEPQAPVIRSIVKGDDPFSTKYKALVNAKGGFISGPGTETSDSIRAMLSKGEFVVNAKSVRKYGVEFFDKINRGIPSPEPYRALVNRSNPLGLDSGSRALVNKFRDGGLVGMDSGYRALVNRFDSNPLGLDSTWRALVNRTIPDTPRVTNRNVEMGGDTGGFMPFIAETKISGQDLKIILARADKRYSNVT